MRFKYLTHTLAFVFIILQILQVHAQQVMQPNAGLRVRLQQYVAANHLRTGSTYNYFDTITHKLIIFKAGDYMVANNTAQEVTPKQMPVSNATVIETGGAFHLVKDVNALTSSNVSNGFYIEKSSKSFAVMNNVSYFVADDGIHGKELWRSDGTAAGTYMLKDIAAGEASAKPFNMTISGTNVYFGVPSRDYNNYTLWKTDGTIAGTIPVKDFVGAGSPGASTGIPSNLCDVNGTLYFTMSNKNRWDQLWKSDGTEAGTVMVKDFNAIGGNNVRSLVSLNGLLYFIGVDATHGAEIWKSDGNDTGTYIVKDINSSAYDSYPNYPVNLTPHNGKLYFAQIDEHNESKLWVTDGTSEGTVPVPNHNSTIVDKYYYGDYYTNIPFTISNNVLYFLGNLSNTGTELFKYDITNERMGLVKDIKPGTDSIRMVWRTITDVNGVVCFATTDSLGIHLYKTRGTANTTAEVKTFKYASGFGNLVNGNGKLYFTASDTLMNDEPWISDGTTAGTVPLKDIYPGTTGSAANDYTACNNKVLFAATDNIHGSELWASTGNKVQLLKDINVTATSSSGAINSYSYINTTIAAFKNGVLTNASTYSKGSELYKADVATEGLIKDFIEGVSGSHPHNLKVKGDTCYFVAQAPVADTTKLGSIYVSENYLTNEAIFKTDGTASGTVQVSPEVGYTIYDFAVTENGTIFFGIFGTYADELWKTDGTKSGTVLLKSNLIFTKGVGFDERGNPNIFEVIGNTVYFGALDYINNTVSKGNELWKSDGTVNGTVIIKDINPGSNSANPKQLTAFRNQLYFSAFDGAETALWKTDGTALGTVKIKSVQPSSLAISNNTLFFNGYTNTTGAELWKTDGTTAGTILVRDINIGLNNSNPSHLTNVDNTLFFNASDSTNKTQLWKSNGTKQSTQLVKNIAPVTDTVSLAYFTSAAGKLFFTMNNKLWVSDGTNKGTGILSDDVLDSLFTYNLTANDNQLFFEGYNYKYGNELYAGDVSGGALVANVVPFAAALQSADVITNWQAKKDNNTAYFNIQRSTDAVHFINAGKVVTNGINQLQQYIFSDVNIAGLITANTIYYRLETVDKEGKTSVSHIVPVDLSRKDIVLLLHPNPVKDVLNMKVNNYAGNVIIGLYDISGKKLHSQQQMVQSGDNVTVSTSHLLTGVYVVKVNLDGKVFKQKFVKE